MAELDNFLVHLDGQTFRDFEVLVVDQNSGSDVSALLARHSLPRQYFRSQQRGAARGRNIALEIAQGDILAIPDDDCWYPPNLLDTIAKWFEGHPDIDMLCISECNPEGEAMVPENPPPAGFSTDQPIGFHMKRSVWWAQSSMVFMRRKVRDTIGLLNESLGVGSDTKYQSGEETDYFLRAMHAGSRMWFEPSIKVFHVELRTPERQTKSTYAYSVGAGYVLRLHHCGLLQLLAVVSRSLGGAVISACRGELRQVSLYLHRAQGIFIGYFGL
jgi:glycosyltransferase involved in cell wall biosynthesis